ncbi:MAG: D-aminoacyl-tRNA deacylase [Acidimicrobiales bacterium]
MRAVVQRVRHARVLVGRDEIGAIREPGLFVLVGVTRSDDRASAATMAGKLWNLRILADEDGRMNRSCADLGAPILVVSQFTLYGDTGHGRRPSFTAAMPGIDAAPLVEELVSCLRSSGAVVATGKFGAAMVVELANDGPVTLIVET